MLSMKNEAAFKGRTGSLSFPEALSSLSNLSYQCVGFFLWFLFFFGHAFTSPLAWFHGACSTCQPEASGTSHTLNCLLQIRGNNCTDRIGDDEDVVWKYAVIRRLHPSRTLHHGSSDVVSSYLVCEGVCAVSWECELHRAPTTNSNS